MINGDRQSHQSAIAQTVLGSVIKGFGIFNIPKRLSQSPLSESPLSESPLSLVDCLLFKRIKDKRHWNFHQGLWIQQGLR
jgi:hypothetical protein